MAAVIDNRDIRIVKRELRAKYSELRDTVNLVDKVGFDEQILHMLIGLNCYKKAKLVLCYVSTGSEVDTHKIIMQALHDDKTVAVPRCLDKNGHMEFRLIRSFNELEPSTFGLMEPIESTQNATDFSDSICILPGLAFDITGYRLGYGKGYYDRFLSRYNGIRIGLNYSRCVVEKLPHSKYDVPVNYIITPKTVKSIKRR